MATTKSGVAQLYADIVADLIPYYDNFVLLPNPQLILNSYNIEDSAGNTIRIPLTNSWTAANSSVGENALIIDNADQSFTPTAANLTITKRGAGSYVTSEAIEDGGAGTLATALTTRLSRSLAQATDTVGFNVFISGAEADLSNVANISGVPDDGIGAATLSGNADCDVSFVMSPEFAAYGMKRSPVVKTFEDINYDRIEYVATVRNGFARLRSGDTGFGVALSGSGVIGETNAAARLGLDEVSAAIARLRENNAPTDTQGFYVAALSPAHEFHLAKEINGVGGIGTGSIGSLSDIGNEALRSGLIGAALGCKFYRSGNVPNGLSA